MKKTTSATTPRKVKRATYHHGELVEALVSAGRKLLEEAGAGELSLRETARRVGVSQTAPLHYLGSKAGLLAAIAAEGFRELASIRRATSAEFKQPDDLLKAHIHRYVRFASKNRGLFQLMFGPSLDRAVFPELRDAALDAYAGFAADVGRYAAAVGWDAADIGLATSAAWGMQHGLANLVINEQLPVPLDPIDLEAVVDRAAAVLVAGLSAVTFATAASAKRTRRKSPPTPVPQPRR